MISSNWVLDPGKFLTRDEVNRLLETARKRAAAAISRGNKVAVMDYFIVDLALSTGLRVAEIADLKCMDIFLRERFTMLFIVLAVLEGSYRTNLSKGLLRIAWKNRK